MGFRMFIKIYFTMVKNYIIGLFTKYYAIEIFAPSNLDKGEFNKCMSIIDGLMSYNDEDGNIKSEEINNAFEQLNKLSEGTIITAYSKVLIKTDSGWESYKPFRKGYKS